MDRRVPDLPKLTENEKTVLKKILDSKRIPDSHIAKMMNLSPQAVFKIRSKLEACGIIQGYMPIVNFKRVGINVMTVLVIRLTPMLWKKFSDDQISDRLSRTPYIIDAYRVSDGEASHVLTMGFRDAQQKERYIAQLQTKFAEEVQIKAIYTFSVDQIISHNPLGLLHEIVDKKEFFPEEIFH